MQQHFVTFYSPGTFVHEETVKPIISWDIDVAMTMARGIVERHGATPFAFRFTTRVRDDDELDSRELSVSRKYFLGGEILTRGEIEARNDPADAILIANMRGNNITRVVKNRNSFTSTHMLDDDDIVLYFEMRS